MNVDVEHEDRNKGLTTAPQTQFPDRGDGWVDAINIWVQ